MLKKLYKLGDINFMKIIRILLFILASQFSLYAEHAVDSNNLFTCQFIQKGNGNYLVTLEISNVLIIDTKQNAAQLNIYNEKKQLLFDGLIHIAKVQKVNSDKILYSCDISISDKILANMILSFCYKFNGKDYILEIRSRKNDKGEFAPNIKIIDD